LQVHDYWFLKRMYLIIPTSFRQRYILSVTVFWIQFDWAGRIVKTDKQFFHHFLQMRELHEFVPIVWFSTTVWQQKTILTPWKSFQQQCKAINLSNYKRYSSKSDWQFISIENIHLAHAGRFRTCDARIAIESPMWWIDI
jgi:hypothetical protein